MFTRLANDIKQQKKTLALAFSNRRIYYQLTIFVLLDNCTSNKKLNDPSLILKT